MNQNEPLYLHIGNCMYNNTNEKKHLFYHSNNLMLKWSMAVFHHLS